MKAVFYCKDGLPTVYALSCGYVAKHETATMWLTLSQNIGRTYRVNLYNFEESIRLFNENYYSLPLAKKAYKKLLKELTTC